MSRVSDPARSDACAGLAARRRGRGRDQLRRRRRDADPGRAIRVRHAPVDDVAPGLRAACRRAADPRAAGADRAAGDVLLPGRDRRALAGNARRRCWAPATRSRYHSHAHRPLVELSEAEQEEDFHGGLEVLRRLGAVTGRLPRAAVAADGVHVGARPRRGAALRLLADGRRPAVRSGTAGRRAAGALVARRLGAVRVPARPDIGSNIETPGKVLELWTGELDAMRSTGSLCLVCCHPFLSGRPSRLRTVERFVEFARGCGDVELLTCGEIAERVLTRR